MFEDQLAAAAADAAEEDDGPKPAAEPTNRDPDTRPGIKITFSKYEGKSLQPQGYKQCTLAIPKRSSFLRRRSPPDTAPATRPVSSKTAQCTDDGQGAARMCRSPRRPDRRLVAARTRSFSARIQRPAPSNPCNPESPKAYIIQQRHTRLTRSINSGV